ncbi:CDP-alcohol phosphatidyltransferase family protein [Tessaracoccus oleiagri]|uniref:CDP-diacylglycerol--glycerol-3-phosphate 3-phosphatidyltransferase n=1 Tax=Tessaracoccus oleiagri TaxID=686624 RepID=A0A1G9MKL8_9ACTN|nr:CDP-alcohol phosphatidyltransferase family protein [Tessaracoccus oleiagri]SDL74195.1 CDP-diacylglycerol--glycerol-3-phosphate 3-phosphatidyltransferase [Tessaracoccus oleiagri]
MQEQEFDTDRVLTVPNLLSFARLAAIPVFTWLIVAEHNVAAVIILAASAVTDWFDGFLARRLRQRTRLGAQLDPVTDRLYILATILAMAYRDIIPWWFVAVLLARDLMLLALLPVIRRVGRDSLRVNYVGKAGTFALLLAFPLILLGSPDALDVSVARVAGWVIGLVGAVLYWAAGFLYLRATRELVHHSRRSQLGQE